MLKIDYTLITEKGAKTRTDIPLEEMKEVNGNVMLVQGPSSMGKSTVMNMIAIGSFGESDESLSNSVRTNLRELTSSSYRDLEFDIELENQYCSTKLSMSKSSGKKDIKVVEIADGQKTILSADSFRRKYNLIYDVPENPTKRLEQIRDTIKSDHRDAQTSINNFVEYLKRIKNEVNKVPSKDAIEQDRNNLASESRQLERYEVDFRDFKTKKMRIHTAVICRKYLTLDENIKRLDEKIANEKKKPALNKSTEQLRSDAMKQYMNLTKDVIIKPDTKEAIISSKNTELIDLLRIALNFNFVDNYNNVRDYFRIISEMKMKVPDNSGDLERVRLINSLLSILKNSDEEMSLGSIGTVKDLLEKLTEFKENSDIGSSADNEKIRKDLARIKINSMRVEDAANKIDKAVDSMPTATRNIAQINLWSNERKKIEEEKKRCIDQLRDDGIAISKVTDELHHCCMEIGISITSKLGELEELEREITNQQNRLFEEKKNCEELIKKYQETIAKYDNNELPKYYADMTYLSNIMDESNRIRSSINDADQRLQKVINHDDSEYRRNPSLYDNIWAYIGSKLEVVRDCGEEHRVDHVDLLNEEKGTIYTEDGIEIHIGAMGTGEGQLSYLRGLLSTGDDRKIIALFDEVGNMSNNLLKSLTDDFIKLEKNGKLMIAFMARPTSDVFEVKVYD